MKTTFTVHMVAPMTKSKMLTKEVDMPFAISKGMGVSLNGWDHTKDILTISANEDGSVEVLLEEEQFADGEQLAAMVKYYVKQGWKRY